MHFTIDGSTIAERHNVSANSMEQFSYMQPIRVGTPFVRVEVSSFSTDVEVIP